MESRRRGPGALVEARFKITGGPLFAVCVMGYTAGRGWVEYLRIDTANHVLGLRLNVWTSLIVFAAAATYFVIAGRRAHTSDNQRVPEASPARRPGPMRRRSIPARRPTESPSRPRAEDLIATVNCRARFSSCRVEAPVRWTGLDMRHFDGGRGARSEEALLPAVGVAWRAVALQSFLASLSARSRSAAAGGVEC